MKFFCSTSNFNICQMSISALDILVLAIQLLQYFPLIQSTALTKSANSVVLMLDSTKPLS